MWQMINYAQVGRGHIEAGLPCQDKTIAKYEQGVYLLGLADGAGSAKFSHFGAQTTLNAVANYLANNFTMVFNQSDAVLVRKALLEKIITSLQVEAKKLNCELKDLASTLLFVAIKDDKFIIFHIGDGVIGYVKNDVLGVVSKPENGEFANTTVFTTSSKALIAMKLFKGMITGFSGFILMSDGSSASFYHKQSGKLAPVLTKIIDKTALTEHDLMQKYLQDSFQVVVDNTHDDCSLAILAKVKQIAQWYFALDMQAKMNFLGIKNAKMAKRIITRYDNIIHYVNEPKDKKQIAKHIHLKEKYINKYVDKLVKLQLIKTEDNHLFYI